MDSIVYCIKNGSFEGYKQNIYNLFLEVKNCSYNKIVKTFYRLAESIIQMAANLNVLMPNADALSVEGIYNSIKSCETFEELEKWFVDLYSFPDYVNNIRLEKAKDLILSNDRISISEVCEKVGFNNKPYFTNSFTKKYGVSPTKYKQLIKPDICSDSECL